METDKVELEDFRIERYFEQLEEEWEDVMYRDQLEREGLEKEGSFGPDGFLIAIHIISNNCQSEI